MICAVSQPLPHKIPNHSSRPPDRPCASRRSRATDDGKRTQQEHEIASNLVRRGPPQSAPSLVLSHFVHHILLSLQKVTQRKVPLVTEHSEAVDQHMVRRFVSKPQPTGSWRTPRLSDLLGDF